MPRMSKADWQLVWEAISHAINERDSFRDAHLGSSHDNELAAKIIVHCDRFIERAEAFCRKHYGQDSAVKQMNDEFARQPTVSIFELVGRDSNGK